jgi:hypothetical protein
MLDTVQKKHWNYRKKFGFSDNKSARWSYHGTTKTHARIAVKKLLKLDMNRQESIKETKIEEIQKEKKGLYAVLGQYEV